MGEAAGYVIVSPVKDEGAYIERTISSVRRQTVLPSVWVLVDDGSCDQTPEIMSHHAAEVEWIRTLRLGGGAKREPGSGVIRAFSAGYASIRHLAYKFVVKLDCDLEFGPEYFESLLSRFSEDACLGIASGMYWEQENDKWSPVRMPGYHAAGAAKMVRRECFEQIGGFVPSRGWDTVDEIRAQVSGWRTKHFEDLRLLHLKREGSGIGNVRTSKMAGEIYYLTGGGPLFFGLKCFHHLVTGRPPIVGAAAMFLGYCSPLIRRRARLVSGTELQHYRRLLNQRILAGVGLSRVSEH